MASKKEERNDFKPTGIIPMPAPPKFSLFAGETVAYKQPASRESFPNLHFKKSPDNTLSMSKPSVDRDPTILELTDEKIAPPKLELQKMTRIQSLAADWFAAHKSSAEITTATPDNLRSIITGTNLATTPVDKDMMNINYAEQVDNIAFGKEFRNSNEYKNFMASKDGQAFKNSKEGKEYLLAIANRDKPASTIPHKVVLVSPKTR